MERLVKLAIGAVLYVCLLGGIARAVDMSITGELRQWHKVTLTLPGPHGSEEGDPTPFLDYRMQVTFRHPSSGLSYVVPGYFAADGNAGNTSATSGNKWRVHLSPDHPGEWTYAVSFRTDPGVAVDDNQTAGRPVDAVEGWQGSFEIAKTDKGRSDLRGQGRLNYVGKHHLQFAGTSEFFLKSGVDAPENFLAYQDFDGDFKADGHKVSTEKKVAWANYFWTHDPYQHHIVIHNGNNHFDMLGDASALTGFSLQTNQPDFRFVHSRTLEYIGRSVAAGKPWVVACDEPGDATHALLTDAENRSHDNARRNALWGNLMAGGAGVEWYFGYKHPHCDLTCQDFRVRQNMWPQCRHALGFFKDHQIPFWNMINANEKLDSKAAYCLHDSGKLYLVYRKYPEQITLDLSGAEGVFEVLWFNPRDGGPLQHGTAQAVRGGAKVAIGNPPWDPSEDWLAVIRPGDPNRDYPPAVSAAAVSKIMLPRSGKTVTVVLSGHVSDDGKAGTELTSQWTKRSGPGEVGFVDASAPNT